jgi:[ribosomal protein S5]-alanine N-acetyltransferase
LKLTLQPARGVADLAPEDRRAISSGDEPFLIEVLRTITEAPRAAPWGAYLARAEDGRIAGLCCFKAEPDSGQAEIAYATLPSLEGQGIGRSMVAALVEIGRTAGAERLIAHTLPQPNASTRVLERSGFIFEGEAIDPEDGLVWRWAHGSGLR